LRDSDPDRYGQDSRRGRVPAGESAGRPPRLAVPRQPRRGPRPRRGRSPPPLPQLPPPPPPSPPRGRAVGAPPPRPPPPPPPALLRPGCGKSRRKGSDLVLQTPSPPDGKPETAQSVVGVYFTRTPARKIVAGVAVRRRDLDIPAGEARYHAAAQSDPLPADVH